MDIVLIVVVKVVFGVHHPFGIAEHRYFYVRVIHREVVQFGKGYVEFRRASGVEDNDVRHRLAECLGEKCLARLQVCYRVVAPHGLHAPAEPESEYALLACGVIAIDEHCVVTGKLLEEAGYHGFIVFGGVLVHLEQVWIGLQLGGVD